MSNHTPHYLTVTNILLVKNGKLLLSRRQNKGWGDGLLCIPGGHVEPDDVIPNFKNIIEKAYVGNEKYIEFLS